jgi:hypothetical protein
MDLGLTHVCWSGNNFVFLINMNFVKNVKETVEILLPTIELLANLL